METEISQCDPNLAPETLRSPELLGNVPLPTVNSMPQKAREGSGFYWKAITVKGTIRDFDRIVRC